jgi:hypothetical protein
MKYKNNLKQSISRNNQKKAKEDINIIKTKKYLTDEDTIENQKLTTIKKDTKKEKKEESIQSLITIMDNIIYLKNNKPKKRKIKFEVFKEIKKHNEELINNYLDYEKNDKEYKDMLNLKNYFL